MIVIVINKNKYLSWKYKYNVIVTETIFVSKKDGKIMLISVMKQERCNVPYVMSIEQRKERNQSYDLPYAGQML